MEYNYGRNDPALLISSKGSSFTVGHPSLIVNDRDGCMPLNVQRDSLVDAEYPFQAELVSSVAEAYVRELYRALLIPPAPENIPKAMRMASEAASRFDSAAKQLIALDASGWIPLEPAVFSRNLREWMLVELFDGGRRNGYITSSEVTMGSNITLVPIVTSSGGQGAAVGFVRSLLDEPYWSLENPAYSYRDHVSGMWVFISQEVEVSMLKKGGLPQFLIRQLECVHRLQGWAVYRCGDPENLEGLDRIIEGAIASEGRVFAYVSLTSGVVTESVTPFYEHWMAQVPDAHVNEHAARLPPDDDSADLSD